MEISPHIAVSTYQTLRIPRALKGSAPTEEQGGRGESDQCVEVPAPSTAGVLGRWERFLHLHRRRARRRRGGIGFRTGTARRVQSLVTNELGDATSAHLHKGPREVGPGL